MIHLYGEDIHQSVTGQIQQTKEHTASNTHTIDENKVVINLPNKELDPAASSILAKDLNFAHTTNQTSEHKRYHQWCRKSGDGVIDGVSRRIILQRRNETHYWPSKKMKIWSYFLLTKAMPPWK
jgi:hypothetical protein